MSEMKVFYRDVDELVPYARNAKKHPEAQVNHVAKSLIKYGWRSAVLIHAGTGEIIAGHCRVLAAKRARMERPELGRVPCIDGSDMTPEQIREYRILDNKLNESEWDDCVLAIESVDLKFDGFFDLEIEIDSVDIEADEEEAEKESKKYEQFIEKFKPKHVMTTDDCYTPPAVYAAIVDWCKKEYGVQGEIVRPFYPGGDYKSFPYKDNCVVIDNPPFSILEEIVTFYSKNKIRFFVFAPTLTLFNKYAAENCSSVICGARIRYENGALVNTSFQTNLEDCRFRTAPTLYRAIEQAVGKETPKKQKYIFPDEVAQAARLGKLCKSGIDFVVSKDESVWHRKLDSQIDCEIFGGGYLISEKKAAEKAAAEKAAAEKWELSKREKEIVRGLG